MQKINLRELYPDMYKTDTFLEVTDEVQAVFLSDKRAEAAHERQMYRYIREIKPPNGPTSLHGIWQPSNWAKKFQRPMYW